MAEFNYTEYLKNNPLLKKETKSTLTENQRPGYHSDGTPKSNDEMSDDEREEFYNDSNFIDEKKSSTKIKVSELKAKIKEDIIQTLSEQDEDYEQASREMEYGISPEAEDDYINPGNTEDQAEEREKYLEKYGKTLPSWMKEEQSQSSDLESELMSDLEETLNEEEEDEDVDVEVDDEEEEDVDVEVEDEEEPSDVDVDTGAESGFSEEEKNIQDGLKTAYDEAVAIGDEKLADQIGNTITMFTRTHIVNR